MVNDVFWDTSGFFASLDRNDHAHERVLNWIQSGEGRRPAVTTEWIVGETCTLLAARKRGHLIGQFLDQIERSSALTVINPDDALLAAAKALIRRQSDRGYSFADCISFCVMRERRIVDVLTADEHFSQAGFRPILSD